MPPYDLLITGADVIDGTGGPRQCADVAISGDRIMAVGNLAVEGGTAKETIDGTGLALAPGFIDVHTHDDRLVLTQPSVAPKTSQGVTTVVTGNCGVSLAPFTAGCRAGEADPPGPMALLGGWADYRFPTLADYNAALADSPAAINVASLIGHTTLRAGVMMDTFDRAATKAEIDAMARVLEQSLKDGAVGLSTGLAYPTAIHAPTDEIVELAACLKDFGALYTTHMRNEGPDLVESVDETIDIARRSGAATVISHHKCVGRENWGKSHDSLAHIKAAQRDMTLDFDVYPYTATSTILLKDFLSTSEKTVLTSSATHPEMVGREFDSIVDEWGCGVDEAIRRLSPAHRRRPPASASVGHLPPGARPLLPGRRRVQPGGGRPPHVRQAGQRVRAQGPRGDPQGGFRRSGAVQPQDGDRPRDLRCPGNACGRDRAGLCERPTGLA